MDIVYDVIWEKIPQLLMLQSQLLLKNLGGLTHAAVFHQHGSEFSLKGFEHLYISGLALIIGIIIAVPLGVLLTPFFQKLPRL